MSLSGECKNERRQKYPQIIWCFKNDRHFDPYSSYRRLLDLCDWFIFHWSFMIAIHFFGTWWLKILWWTQSKLQRAFLIFQGYERGQSNMLLGNHCSMALKHWAVPWMPPILVWRDTDNGTDIYHRDPFNSPILNGNPTKRVVVLVVGPIFASINTLIRSLCHLLSLSDINDGFNFGNLQSRREVGRFMEYLSSWVFKGLHLTLKVQLISCILVARCLHSSIVLQQ